jgi:hypothetical protein
VSPDDRQAAYVPMAEIDQAGSSFKEALTYLRGLPGNYQLPDRQLRDRYRARIERAFARSLMNGTRTEIENALKGQD